MPTLTTIPLSKLIPDPMQPRQDFDANDLDALKKSIASNGILKPLDVEKHPNGGFIIVDGERRYRSAKQLGLTEVPAIVSEKHSDLERLIRRFHIQMQTKNWSVLDQAVAIKNILEQGEISADEVSKLLGVRQQNVADLMTLNSLPKKVSAMTLGRKLDYQYAVAIGRVARFLQKNGFKADAISDLTISLADRAVKHNLGVRGSRMYSETFAFVKKTLGKEAVEDSVTWLIKHADASGDDFAKFAKFDKESDRRQFGYSLKYMLSKLKQAGANKNVYTDITTTEKQLLVDTKNAIDKLLSR